MPCVGARLFKELFRVRARDALGLRAEAADDPMAIDHSEYAPNAVSIVSATESDAVLRYFGSGRELAHIVCRELHELFSHVSSSLFERPSLPSWIRGKRSSVSAPMLGA